MRLWHKDLIPVLPQKQLVAQWRECCCMVSNIAKNGTPNHILVNYILEYSLDEFREYTQLVLNEMRNRGYKISKRSIENFRENAKIAKSYFNNSRKHKHSLYYNIHNDRYFWQCYMNIQEKYDRGMFNDDEWKLVETKGKEYIDMKGSIKI